MVFQLAPANPLRRPGYRFFLLFSICSAMGGGFHFVAGYWILYEHTESPTSVAWLILAFWMPSLLVLPLGGVFVDRFNRRLILALIYAYLSVLNVGLVALMAVGVFQPKHLYVYGVLSSFAHALGWTAMTAYLQQVLRKDELLHANSLNVALFQGGYLLGAGSAGIFYERLGGVFCFSVDAAGCFVATLGWLWIGHWFADRDPSSRREGSPPSILADFVEGLRHIRADLALFVVALFMLIPRLAAQVINVLHMGFSASVLKTGAEGFGLMDMAYGLGAMLCGLLFPMVTERFGVKPRLPLAALAILSVCFLGISFSNSLVTAMFALAILGGAANIVGVLARTMLQREASGAVMGRITSTIQICQYLLIPPVVWTIGAYASLSSGRLLHQETLRDAFVIAAIIFGGLTLLGHLAMSPFIRARWKSNGA